MHEGEHIIHALILRNGERSVAPIILYVGARTGMQSDDHHVDDLLIEAGSAYRPEPVPLELTLNGLQFSSGGLSFEYPTNTVHHLLGIEETEATQLPVAA